MQDTSTTTRGYASRSVLKSRAQLSNSASALDRSVSKFGSRSDGASPARERSRTPKAMSVLRGTTLSQAIASSKSMCTTSKLSVVEKYVEKIDAVDDCYRLAETIFLSNNSISSLKGIEQFPHVRVLSLANNCIASMGELDHLAKCRNLHTLSLQYNPITQLPNYRAHVISKIPWLQVLDNKEITEAERENSIVVVKKEETMMNMMFTNECLIAKLRKAIHKIRLHNELRAHVFSRTSIWSTAELPDKSVFETGKVLNTWDMEDVLSEQDRDHVYDALRREVKKCRNVRIFGGGILNSSMEETDGKKLTKSSKRANEPWDISFSEVLLQQQNTIAELLSQIEFENKQSPEPPEVPAIIQQEKEEQLQKSRLHITGSNGNSTVGKSSKNELRLQIQRSNSYPSMSNITPIASGKQLTSARSAGSEGEQQGPLTISSLESSKNNNITREAPAKALFAEVHGTTPQTLRNMLPKQQKEPATTTASTAQHSKSEHRITPPRSRTPLRGAAQATAGNAVSAKKPTTYEKVLSKSCLVVSKDTKIENLKKQIELLQSEIEQRVQGQTRLQEINLKLRERLEMYQKQNQENVDRAEAEIALLQNQIQQISHLQQQREEQLQRVEKEKKECLEELQTRLSKTETDKSKLTERLQQMEEQIHARESMLQQLIKKQELVNEELDKAFSEREKLEAQLQAAHEELAKLNSENENIKKKASEYSKELKQLFLHEHQEEKADQLRRLHLLRKTLRQLHEITQRNKHIKAITERNRAKRTRECALRCLRSLAYWALVVIRRCNNARKKRLGQVQRKVLRNWHQFAKSEKELANRELIARDLHATFLKWRCFSWWKARCGVEEQSLTERALVFRQSYLKSKVFIAWKQWVQGYVQTLRHNLQAYQNYRVKLQVSKAFFAWRANYADRCKSRQMMATAQAHNERRLVKRGLSRWIQYHSIIRREKDSMRKAVAHHRRRLLRRCFGAWKRTARRSRQRHLAHAFAIDHYFKKLRVGALYKWKEFVRESKQERRRKMLVTFNGWRKYTKRAKYERYLKNAAITFIQEAKRNKLQESFYFWRRAFREKQQQKQSEQILVERCKLATLRRYFHLWIHRLFQNTRRELFVTKQQYASLQQTLQSHSDKSTSIELENVQLINRLQELVAELSRTQAQLKDKNQEIDDLKTIVQDNMILENSLRTEIERYKQRMLSLQDEIKRLVTQINTITDNKEEENLTAQKLLDLQSVEKAAQNLKAHLADKEGQLLITQQALRDSEARLQEALAESREALIVINSLRTAVAERDQKLHEARAAHDRDALLIKQQKAMLEDRERQIATMQRAVEEESRAKDERIKRLEYEIELLEKREVKQTERFINELAHSSRTLTSGTPTSMATIAPAKAPTISATTTTGTATSATTTPARHGTASNNSGRVVGNNNNNSNTSNTSPAPRRSPRQPHTMKAATLSTSKATSNNNTAPKKSYNSNSINNNAADSRKGPAMASEDRELEDTVFGVRVVSPSSSPAIMMEHQALLLEGDQHFEEDLKMLSSELDKQLERAARDQAEIDLRETRIAAENTEFEKRMLQLERMYSNIMMATMSSISGSGGGGGGSSSSTTTTATATATTHSEDDDIKNLESRIKRKLLLLSSSPQQKQ